MFQLPAPRSLSSPSREDLFGPSGAATPPICDVVSPGIGLGIIVIMIIVIIMAMIMIINVHRDHDRSSKDGNCNTVSEWYNT